MAARNPKPTMPVRLVNKSWSVDFRFGGERCRKRSPLNTRPGTFAYEMFFKKKAGLYGSIGAALGANTPQNRMPCPTLEEFAPRWSAGYVIVNNRSMEQQHKRVALTR
jgi:hypothetical protein